MSLSRQRPRNRVNSRANTLPSLLITSNNNDSSNSINKNNNTTTSTSTITTETTTTTENVSVDPSSSFLPSIEESLQDWLTRSIPDTASSSSSLLLLESCPCCNKVDCENLDTLSGAIRKLESDARLAAEIGQSLLHKHEQSVIASNEMKAGLEEQLDQVREKVRELEQSLLESDIKKQELEEEQDKSKWELQKTQKTLDETVTDLEAANNRCIQLGSELKAKSSEVDALRVFKIMARQADIREDALRVMLEDNKHELGISRKKELSLESKHRKLKAKYESLCIAYERLKLNQQEMGLTNCSQLDILWLKESNEKLRKDVLKLTSALLSPPTGDAHMIHQNQLLELIKELASANTKLKNDLLDCRDLLVESHGEIMALVTKMDEIDNSPPKEAEDYSLLKKSSYSSLMKIQQYHANINQLHNTRMLSTPEIVTNDTWLSKSAPPLQTTDEAIPKTLKRRKESNEDVDDDGDDDICKNHPSPSVSLTLPITNKTMATSTSSTSLTEPPPPQPTPSTSLSTSGGPSVVHHHYHYYLRNNKKIMDEKGKLKDLKDIKDNNNIGDGNGNEKNSKKEEAPEITLSPSSSLKSMESTKVGEDLSSPFRQLHIQISVVLQRLKQTDIRALNRRLRRAFDMLELSSMSNSIIENIISDAEGLRARFMWIEDKSISKENQPWINDISMLEFFPIVSLIQDMIKEISHLRTTMNDLQVEYFKKVEESDIRLEEELLRKQQQEENKQSQRKHKSSSSSGGTSNNNSSNNNNNNNNGGGSSSPLSWLANVFQRASQQQQKYQQQEQQKQQHPHQKVLYPSQSHDSLHTRFITNNNSSDISIGSSSTNIVHPLAVPVPSTSSCEDSNEFYIRRNIRRKKSDIDRHGPPSSFPTRSSLSEKPKKHRSSIIITTPPAPQQLRASQSAGTVRIQPALEYAVRRKRSTLGLDPSSSNEYSSSPGSFGTNWLGNK